MEPRRTARLPEDADGVLADALRLARRRGGAERIPAIHHQHRRPDHPFRARALAREPRDAAHADPRLAGLDRRVHGPHRAAQQSPRPRWRSRRRLPPRDPVDAGARVFAATRRPGMDAPPHRRGVHGADAPPRLRTLRRAGRRRGRVHRSRNGPHRSRAHRGHPHQCARAAPVAAADPGGARHLLQGRAQAASRCSSTTATT